MVDKLEEKQLLPDMSSKEPKSSAETSKNYSASHGKIDESSAIRVIVRKLIQFIADGTFLNSENIKSSNATAMTRKDGPEMAAFPKYVLSMPKTRPFTAAY